MIVVFLAEYLRAADRLQIENLKRIVGSVNQDESDVLCDFTSSETSIEKGLTFSFLLPSVMYQKDEVDVDGIMVRIRNSSKEVFVIKWGQSSIFTDGRSCIPFLAGMKYRDAGNPSATPDSVIPPDGEVAKTIFFSDQIWGPSPWTIGKVFLKLNQSMKFILVLKIQKGNESPNYYTINSPVISCIPKQK